MTLGERIRENRVRAGLSQEQLAELTGVSRQAVGKWEAGQAAPGAEKLQRLADLFGESMVPPAAPPEEEPGPVSPAEGLAADVIAPGPLPAAEGGPSLAEEVLALARQEEAAQKTARRAALLRNVRWFLAVCGAYLLLYLLGRLIWCGGPGVSAAGWLWASRPDGAHSYLFGWLLSSRLFWWAAAVSSLPALFGKVRFSLATLAGFVLGFLLGLAFGPNPAGEAIGQGHYGWAIWGAVFLLSCPAGALAQVRKRRTKGKEKDSA